MIHRMDGGSGSALVSSGVPLPPGVLTVAGGTDLSTQVRLLINGEPQPIYAEALYGFHPSDGSRMAILVQSTQTVNDGSPVEAVLEFGTNTVLQAKTEVTWGVPQAAALPTNVEYLMEWWPLGPLMTRSEAASNSAYAELDDAFEYWSAYHGRGNNYYDRCLSSLVFWVRTGEAIYWYRGIGSAADWGTWGATSNVHNLQPESFLLHYLMTGRPYSRSQLRIAVEETNFWNGPRRDLDETNYNLEGRIQQRLMLMLLYDWILEIPGEIGSYTGAADAPAEVLADELVQRWIDIQEEDGSIRYNYNGDNQMSSFMEGLRMTAAIRHYQLRGTVTGIPDMIQGVLDFMIANLWIDDGSNQNHSFQYSTNEFGASGPLLNPLIIGAMGFAYDQTGLTTYRTYGDEMQAATLSWIPSNYQYNDGQGFNQGYYSSWNYPVWAGLTR